MKYVLLLITSLFIGYNSYGMQSNTQKNETVTIQNTKITRFETPALIAYRRQTPVREDFATYTKETAVFTATAYAVTVHAVYGKIIKPIEAATDPHSLFNEIERQFNTRAL